MDGLTALLLGVSGLFLALNPTATTRALCLSVMTAARSNLNTLTESGANRAGSGTRRNHGLGRLTIAELAASAEQATRKILVRMIRDQPRMLYLSSLAACASASASGCALKNGVAHEATKVTYDICMDEQETLGVSVPTELVTKYVYSASPNLKHNMTNS